jgi:Coenzyme PQQ synthesis protein D (PqqD)
VGTEQNSGGVRVNGPHVIHEAIEGEVIIINLSTGNYYSLKGTGADAWSLIQRPEGVGAEDLVNALAARYEAGRQELEAALDPFLDELRNEGLVAIEPAVPAAAHGASVLEEPPANGRRPFEPPSLEKYTDMQDLVLLDPVHEVDETGWPQARPDVSAAGEGA